MKMLKSLLAGVLLVTLLASGSFAFRNKTNDGPNEVERNAYEYPTVEEIVFDKENVALVYDISVITLDEYREVWKLVLDHNQGLVDNDAMTKAEQTRLSKMYRTIYDELQLDHGMVKRIVRTDGSVQYKYHSKMEYYRIFGDTNTVFYHTFVEDFSE